MKNSIKIGRANSFCTETDLKFEVKGTGIGNPKEQQSLIFESFRQVKQKNMNQFGGSGLGLTISKRISEMMNGKLPLVSEPGNGSTFTLQFDKIPIITSQLGPKCLY